MLLAINRSALFRTQNVIAPLCCPLICLGAAVFSSATQTFHFLVPAAGSGDDAHRDPWPFPGVFQNPFYVGTFSQPCSKIVIVVAILLVFVAGPFWWTARVLGQARQAGKQPWARRNS